MSATPHLCPKSSANETDRVAVRWVSLMSFELSKKAADGDPMERRIIRVDMLFDQAGIAAALRRAFTERLSAACADDDMFDALLKQLN